MSSVADVLKLTNKDLKAKDGNTNGPLEGVELLSIYFSAHWCPPCRDFTPKLAACYEEVNAKKKRWEIVFVSSDRNEAGFNDYFSTMPWLALPYDPNSEDKNDLFSKHSIRGIPALVFLDPKDGSVITNEGRRLVEADLKGTNFPWKQ